MKVSSVMAVSRKGGRFSFARDESGRPGFIAEWTASQGRDVYLPDMPFAPFRPLRRSMFLSPLPRAVSLAAALFLATAPAAVAATTTTPATTAMRTGHAWAEIVSGVSSIAPRDSFTIALRLRPDPGWHVYWSNPGDAGMPPSLTWKLPNEWSVTPLRFPVPTRQDIPPLASFGYEDEVWYPATVVAGAGDAGSRVSLRVRAEWLICREECLPEAADFALTLDVGRTVPHPQDAGRLQTHALARLPQPQPDWDWTMAYDDTSVTIAWDSEKSGGTSGPDDGVFFFPAEIGMLVHAAPQTFAVRDGRATLTMKRDDVLHVTPDTMRGVMAFGKSGTARPGFELVLAASPGDDARPGIIPAVLIGLLVLAGLVLLIAVKRPHVDSAR